MLGRFIEMDPEFPFKVEIYDDNASIGGNLPLDWVEWCVEYVGEQGCDWSYLGGVWPIKWGFVKEEDAMAFKLRWVE